MEVPVSRCAAGETSGAKTKGPVRSRLASVLTLGALVWAAPLVARAADVDGPEARKLLEGGALLLDVRTAAEFAEGHLPGAVNISHDELPRRLDEVTRLKPQKIVVYCRSGRRSAIAQKTLWDAGYADVRDLGAIGRW